MPLRFPDGEVIYTSHASKQSKINFKIFQAHTSVLVPLLVFPVAPFPITLKWAAISILVLIFLERRGLTLGGALRRLRSKMAGHYRYSKTARTRIRRINNN